MNKTVFALIMVVAIAYAVPSAVQEQAGIIIGAERNLIRTTTYQITLQKEIDPGISEIIGRKYLVQLNESITGVFLNENGTAWIQNSAPSQDSQIQKAIAQAEPAIVLDMANIEHIKKYTVNPSPNELTAYQKYFTQTYGGLYQVYSGDAKSLDVEQVAQDIIVDPKQSNGTTIIKQSSDSQLASSNGSNYPAIQLAQNVSVQKGDIVYAIILNSTNGTYGNPKIESTIIKDVKPDEIVVDNVSQGISALVDQNGQIIGLGTGTKDQVTPSDDILGQLNKSNLANMEGPITAAYVDAVHQYGLGNTSGAIKNLDEVAKVDALNPGVVYYNQKIQDGKNPVEKFVMGNWQILVIFLAVIGIGMIVLRFSSGNSKRR